MMSEITIFFLKDIDDIQKHFKEYHVIHWQLAFDATNPHMYVEYETWDEHNDKEIEKGRLYDIGRENNQEANKVIESIRNAESEND